jgi:NTE family protein
MTRIGLVLGGGGVVGQAYHAAVLAVLQHDFAFDARTADVIVGTSAGSITGALLRLGVSAEDLAAWTVKAPLSTEDDAVRRMSESDLPELSPFRALHLLRRPLRLPGWHLLHRAATRPWRFRLLAAASTLLAPGRHDIVGQLSALQDLEGEGWPKSDLLICAVRQRDGRRVIFGLPDAPPARLHQAVAASCAFPGYFAPVQIDGHAYVDGGAHSPTNAAILRNRGLDLAIIVSPMSGPPGLRPDLYAAARMHAARLLDREVRALERSGVKTLVFAPQKSEQRVMGNDMMSRRHLHNIIQHSFLAAGAHAGTATAHDLLRTANGTENGRRGRLDPSRQFDGDRAVS